MAQDPYAVLGVDKNATDAEIKKKYLQNAKENQPDQNPGDAAAEARFKEASQANAILGDPDTRARFDRGEIDASGQERPEPQFYRPHAEGSAGTKYHRYETFDDLGDLGSVFEDLFRAEGRGARAGARAGAHAGAHAGAPEGGPFGFGQHGRGHDVRYRLDVDFLDAAHGVSKRVSMPDGRTLDIAIPKGIQNGQTLRLKGQGMPGDGGDGSQSGDAFVTVSVQPHAFFHRDGDDIRVSVPISLREAVLGAKVKVPTIDGPVTLTVPENASTGDVLRLKGRGIRSGNQLVTLEIMAPKDGDAELQQFLRDHPDTGEGVSRAHLGV